MIKKILLFSLVLLLLVAAAAGVWYVQNKPSAPTSQAWINGNVLTINSQNQVAEALLAEGDRIVAVGSDKKILSMANSNSLIHDLAGATLMPGIIDAHGHFPGAGIVSVTVDLNSPPIGEVTDIPMALRKLKAKVAKTKHGQWVVGTAYDDTLLKEQRHFTRQDLDSVSTEHPILVNHISGHFAVVNSMALQMSGITEQSVAPEGGVFGRDAKGQLTGLLEETAMDLVLDFTADFSYLQLLEIVNSSNKKYLSQGVTSAQNGLANVPMISGMGWLSKLGLIKPRLMMWPDLDSAQQLMSGQFQADNLISDSFDIGAVKLQADGSIQGYSGYLKQPYFTIPDTSPADYVGYPRTSQEQLNDTVLRLHKAGRQLAIHGNGDAAIDMIIHSFAAAQVAHPVADPRMILIHAQMATDKQLAQMAQLGITPSFFNSHVYYWGDRHKQRFIGPERANRISPMASALDNQLRFSLHCDTPVVPMLPWLAAWNATTRRTLSGDLLGFDQGISIQQALRAVTIDAAWQIFKETELGSLEPGKFADLVVLADNPLLGGQALKNMQVLQTYVGGVEVYRRP